MTDIFPPLGPDDMPETRAKGEPWHKGLMVTQRRAIAVAKALFPDEAANGTDCRAEIGREGEPCRACADANAQWVERVRQVRQAMIDAF